MASFSSRQKEITSMLEEMFKSFQALLKLTENFIAARQREVSFSVLSIFQIPQSVDVAFY